MNQSPDNPLQSEVPLGDELPAVLPGFDLDAGLQRLQGNRALYIRLLRKFASGYSGVGDEIERAIEAGDLQQVHALVHNLKGLAGNLSATQLFDAARTLDASAKSGAPDPERLRVEFQALRSTLAQALASAGSIGPKPALVRETVSGSLPAAQLLDLVRTIREAIDVGDVMSIHDAAAGLAAGSAYAERIRELVDAFDFEGLQALADEMEREADR